MKGDVKDMGNTFIHFKSNQCKRLFKWLPFVKVLPNLCILSYFVLKWYQFSQPHPLNHCPRKDRHQLFQMTCSPEA